MKKAVLALSGGMDSSTLLIYLLSQGYEVKTIGINYGQKHNVELDRANQLISYLCSKEITSPDLHHCLNIPLQDLITSSSLMKGGSEVPEGHYQDENMKQTVVPNRNKIFSSILQAAALAWAIETNSIVEIAMGIHAGDHAIYPDCRQEFRDADHRAFEQGNWDADKVVFSTPFLDIDKQGILEIGQTSCERLGIDFDEVYRRTNTSYKPIKIGENWYSDYKSASSVERIEAFINLGRKDPVQYADEAGVVGWEHAKSHVEKVLRDGSR